MTDAIREERRRETAEDFTPPELANAILDKLPPSVWKPDKTFVDPACGNGNLLIPALQRKLTKGHDPIQALRTIFGTDIMEDNIRECRQRLLDEASKSAKITEEMKRTVSQNIVCTPLPDEAVWPVTGYERGSLDYGFGFATI